MSEELVQGDTSSRVTPEVGQSLDFSLETKIRQSAKDPNVFTFVITNGKKDRHDSRVNPNGMDFSDYKRNPVVLFNHDYNKIVGTAANIRRAGDAIIADVIFDTGAAGEEIRGMVERNVLRATSIGFMVKKWSYEESTDTFIIDESELLEFSIVTVPSNRDALIVRSRASEMRKDIERMRLDIEELKGIISKMVSTPTKDESESRSSDPDEAADSDTDSPSEDPQEDALDAAPDEIGDTGSANDEALESGAESDEQEPSIQKSLKSLTIAEALSLARYIAKRKTGRA